MCANIVSCYRMLQLREYAPTVPEVLVLVGTLLLAYFITKRLRIRSDGNEKKYAPSVGCLPIIGSVPYLPNLRELHRWSLDKSYKLGGVFSFQIGNV